MPDPFVPIDLDLRDFPTMPLDVTRLRDRDLSVKASRAEFHAAIMLWCAAWHQVPASSLPNDDQVLARLACYGRDIKGWRAVRDGTLHGFVKCSDDRKSDPTAGKGVAKPKTKGFPVWTEEELEQYEARWPIGTRERVMFGVYCFTGLRRGDAARLGRQHIRNGVITIDTEKTGTRVTIPVLPELAEILTAGPTGELSIIASKKGQPLRKEVVGTLFKKACRAAGIPNKSAHGIRKAAATRAANNGATVATLEAIFGWEGGQMAALYTKAADRRKLAADHMEKLSKSGTSIPAPSGEVRAVGQKD
ncbi:MAG: tyrosine-type recombinase/integrase [Bradyrhizobium sp.]|nr:tyrosine-type recombinase/integrase [Bradyrhizobium sp.]